MTIELRPMSVACNLGCTYCYQESIRKAGNVNTKYDIDKMLRVAEATGQEFCLFGGEALLIPKHDLEKFFKRGFELYKHSYLQTNGTLIDDDHIKMFKDYNVTVGVSIDGPGELNSLRVVRGKKNNNEATLESTHIIIENIRRLSEAQIETSIIVTLHKINGTSENLLRLLNFMRWLGDIGVKAGNIHTLEVDKTMPNQDIHVLTEQENAEAFLTIAEFLKENPDLNWSPFSELKSAMEGNDDDTNCIWNNCDPMNTQAVYGVEGDGQLSNCGRTNKEGIEWYKADDLSFERYISLYNSPQELGGCNGCRFFMLCGGSCPGEGVDNDFRNKTIHCHTQKAILGYYENEVEQEGKTPFSKRKDLKELERIMINSFMNNESINVKRVLEISNNTNRYKETRTINVRR